MHVVPTRSILARLGITTTLTTLSKTKKKDGITGWWERKAKSICDVCCLLLSIMFGNQFIV